MFNIETDRIVQLESEDKKFVRFFILSQDGVITSWLSTQDLGRVFHVRVSLEEANTIYDKALIEGFKPTESLMHVAFTLDEVIEDYVPYFAHGSIEMQDLLKQWAVVHDKIVAMPGGQSFLDTF